MKVHVKLMATLRSKLPPGAKGGAAEMDVPEGQTVGGLLESLGIVASTIHLSMVNGAMEPDRSRVLKEGDEVTAFPPVAGGQCSRRL